MYYKLDIPELIAAYERLEQRLNKIEKALKEFSTKNPDLAEALKHVGL